MLEVFLGHLPPPSTLYLFYVWFYPRRAPFFCRSKAAVHENFVPVDAALFVKVVDEGMPHVDEDARFFPFS